jgi:hypothetical protein
LRKEEKSMKIMSSEEEAEFTGDSPGKQEEYDEDEDEDDEDDVPLYDLKTDRKRSSTTPSYVEEDDDSDDDDDDIPLASLMKPKATVPKAKKNGKSAVKAPPKKKAKKAKEAAKPTLKITKQSSTVSTKSSNGDKKYEWASFALYGTECDKGLLIQRLLCRWWYAITWPDPSKIPEKPPKKYDSLEGFTGVYVCTSGDKVGDIMDLRGKEECPSFANFARKSSQELRELLLKALEEQKKQLVAAEGTGTTTEKELNTLIKWATKVKVDKADKEAVKVLKASKLELPVP